MCVHAKDFSPEVFVTSDTPVLYKPYSFNIDELNKNASVPFPCSALIKNAYDSPKNIFAVDIDIDDDG